MAKITLDRETFKALASDTRLDILKTLDGKHMGLNDIAKATNLNKATLHEHLTKLNDAGLIKRAEREGHKWVYYRLTWKGESLLHPENTRIVVLFTMTFMTLAAGILQLISYVKGTIMNLRYNILTIGNEQVITERAFDFQDRLITTLNANTSSLPTYGLPDIPPGAPDVLRDFILRTKSSQLPYTDSYSLSLDKQWTYIHSVEDTGALAPNAGSKLVIDPSQGVLQAVYQDPTFLYIAIGCFVLFSVVLCVALWRLWENKTPKF